MADGVRGPAEHVSCSFDFLTPLVTLCYWSRILQISGTVPYGPIRSFFRRKYFGIGICSLSTIGSSAGEEGDKTSRYGIAFGLVRFLGDI